MTLPDPAAEIAALSPGAVWQAVDQGEYTTFGITLSKPIVIQGNGATFNNPLLEPPSSGPVKPIIGIRDTVDVTVENVILNGANPQGTGRAANMVGQAGVDIKSSEHVTLVGIAVNNVWGDGLTLAFQPRKPINADITVDGYAINGTGAIRQGVTVAFVDGATLNDVTIQNSAGWDFESDVGVGSGNVTVNNYSGSAGIRMISTLTGPVTFNDADFQGNITLINQAAASGQPVTFSGGMVQLKRRYQGTPPAGLWVRGPGNLTLENMTVGRQPGVGQPSGPAWSVTEGGHLTLSHCPVTPPYGSNDALSTVTITP
jgi:hypothetical protein